MKLVRLSLALGAILVAACSDGKPGETGKQGAEGAPAPVAKPTPAPANINQVLPRGGLVDRALTLTISFDGAPDLSSAKLEMGDGIHVGKVNAAGASLTAELVIDAEARIGARDVTVTVADHDPIVAKSAFHVAVSMGAKVGAGKAEQGGLVRVDVKNHDEVWFDTENFLLLPMVDPKTPSLVPLSNVGFTATDGSVVLLGDPLAKTGPVGFLGINDPSNPDSPSFLSEGDAATISARQPKALTPSATAAEITLANDLETAFFSLDLAPAASEGLLVDALAVAPQGSTMTPMIFAYPASGSIADLLDQRVEDAGFPAFGIPATDARVAYPVTAATKGFFVLADANLTNAATTRAALTYTTSRATIQTEKAAAHATGATAQSLGQLPAPSNEVPGRILTGALGADKEVDFYRFTNLAEAKVTNVQFSITSDAEVVVYIDTVPTMDSDDLVELTLGGSAGNTLTALKGKDRYVAVRAAEDAAVKTGKYTLGVKRLPAN